MAPHQDRTIIRILFSIFIGLFLIQNAACVSIGLSQSKTKKSDKVDYKEPNGVFKSVKSESADAAWIDKKTGNLISYQSSCHESADPNLKVILDSAIGGVQSKNIYSQKSFRYNKRSATRTKLSGRLDGVTVMLDLVVFKKNKCSYILSYVGLPEHFNKGIIPYNKFVKGFVAQ